MIKKLMTGALLASAAAIPAFADDFGMAVQQMLAERSVALFGIGAPLAESAPATTGGVRTPTDNVGAVVALADGLSARFLTRNAGNNFDMFSFFPAENPTHIIGCVEGNREEIEPGKFNPGVQRVSLADGTVETIVRGTVACDPVRTTAWGTIIFGEERADGGFYEVLDPLNTTNVTITDRATGATTDPTPVVLRMALPTIAWEGIVITADGIVYAGDELRPGTGTPDKDGGAIFKFIPATPFMGGMITALDQSPFAAGAVYAMQVSCVSNQMQFGQGCEIGNAGWIPVNAATATADADAAGATGYYRPEDMDADPLYTGEGIRFCWTNTGNAAGGNYGEVVCATDVTPHQVADAAGAMVRTTAVNRVLEGDTQANAFDNIAFQPHSGIMYVIEDNPNGDIWACLRDGADRDIKTDGCIRILSTKDSAAEPTGFIFTADGMTAYVAVQHSDDTNMPKVDGYGTDDILVITGFRAPAM